MKILKIAILLLTSSVIAWAGYPVTDSRNIAQARLINSRLAQQINKLNSLIQVENRQLDELEKIYAAIGSPQNIAGASGGSGGNPVSGLTGGNNPISGLTGGNNPIAGLTSGGNPVAGLAGLAGVNPNVLSNPTLANISSLMDVDLSSLSGDSARSFVTNFLDMDFSDWKRMIGDPKEAFGDMVMDQVSNRIISKMGLPSGAALDIASYLQNIDDVDIEDKAEEIANDMAQYYYAHYVQRTHERTQRNAALTAKTTAITEEIEKKVKAGDATLNEQISGTNQLSAAQAEILLNTSSNLNEANEALIINSHALRTNAEELNEFERDRERARALMAP
jgi:hypothetical protein